MKRSAKEDAVYLEHMLEQVGCIERILASAAEHEIRQLAMIRCFEVIGEAATHVSKAFRAANPDIPWHKMIGMRNALIHDYLGIEEKDLWSTAQDDIPILKKQLQQLLKK